MFLNNLKPRLGVLAFAATLGAIVASVGTTARAAVLWYDGFATPPYVAAPSNATPLDTQSGGTGAFFTGPWSHQSGNDHHVDATSLPHGDLIPGVTTINPSVGGSVV